MTSNNAAGQVRPMTQDDLDLVLSWRNHAEVRRYMYTQHEISLAEHTSWFKELSQDSSRHLLIFESEAVPLGFINIHQRVPGGIANWGFYTDPDAPKGTGRTLGIAALDYAFNSSGLHKICGEALSYNRRSIEFHLRMGFKQEGIHREQHFDGQNYHDIVSFGLLASEWRERIQEI